MYDATLLKLKPTKDREYILSLIDKDNAGLCTRKEVEEIINKNQSRFWTVNINGIRQGIAGYLLYQGIYILEAIKDHTQPAVGIRYSIAAGKIVIAQLSAITRIIYSCSWVKDRAVQRLCRCLGFSEIATKNGFVIYRMEL
jgi:hypothetical protein